MLLLIPTVLWIHGYHPYADDAALYGAGIKHVLHPHMFSAAIDVPFLDVHRRFSVYENAAALLFRLLHLSPEWGLFLLHIAGIWLYLKGIDCLTVRLFPGLRSRLMSLLIATACFTLPVAGSSIFLMDPFVTARSFTTPLALFVVCAAVDRQILRVGLLSAGAMLLHPIMGIYLLFFATVHFLVSDRRWRLLWIQAGLLLLLFAGVFRFSALHPVSSDYQALIWTRRYLFLSKWQWYEVLGLLFPLLLLAGVALGTTPLSARRTLAISCVFLGSVLAVSSLLFVHLDGSYLLARIQLLRGFQIVYLTGMVMLASWLGRLASGRRLVLFLLPVLAAVGMHLAQRSDFFRSLNVELPGRANPNPWHQAFLWLRDHTDASAVIAADPDLMEVDGEGHESPRPTAERSVLASNKDGGVAVLSPGLTDFWTAQTNAQARLDTESDAKRRDHLEPFGVSWVLLAPGVTTTWSCPFLNEAVKVCRLP